MHPALEKVARWFEGRGFNRAVVGNVLTLRHPCYTFSIHLFETDGQPCAKVVEEVCEADDNWCLREAQRLEGMGFSRWIDDNTVFVTASECFEDAEALLNWILETLRKLDYSI